MPRGGWGSPYATIRTRTEVCSIHDGIVTLRCGDAVERLPACAEALRLVEPPDQHVVVNLLGLPLQDRPGFFTGFLAHLHELRVRTGRPHWLVADEAHHLLPAAWQPTAPALTAALPGLLLITVHPDQIAPTVLAAVEPVIAVGASPERTMTSFSEALGVTPHPRPRRSLLSLEKPRSGHDI